MHCTKYTPNNNVRQQVAGLPGIHYENSIGKKIQRTNVTYKIS